jgi:DNA-binding NarL/FixJ family response regulator
VTATETETGSRRRVVLVDDHVAFLDLLRFALGNLDDLECVGVAESPTEAEDMVAAHSPDIVVVDLMLGDDDGLDVVRRLRAADPDLVIVVASARSDTYSLASAAAAGANGFAPKRGALAELLVILRSARPGRMSIAPGLVPTAGTHPPAEPPPVRLTDRERNVLELMARGASVPAMAELLKISISTCRTYVRGVHSKLGVRTQVEAVLVARRIGLIESPEHQ